MAQPYIATAAIEIGNARGYNVGDVVADEVVKAHGLEDSVVRSGTKAAESATKSA